MASIAPLQACSFFSVGEQGRAIFWATDTQQLAARAYERQTKTCSWERAYRQSSLIHFFLTGHQVQWMARMRQIGCLVAPLRTIFSMELPCKDERRRVASMKERESLHGNRGVGCCAGSANMMRVSGLKRERDAGHGRRRPEISCNLHSADGVSWGASINVVRCTRRAVIKMHTRLRDASCAEIDVHVPPEMGIAQRLEHGT